MLNPEDNTYFFGISALDNPVSIKPSASYHLRQISHNYEFVIADKGKIGTNSLCKLAIMIARSNVYPKDSIDTWFHLKGHRKQQDTYANVTIPYIDAKTAATLYKGGHVSYIIVVHGLSIEAWFNHIGLKLAGDGAGGHHGWCFWLKKRPTVQFKKNSQSRHQFWRPYASSFAFQTAWMVESLML